MWKREPVINFMPTWPLVTDNGHFSVIPHAAGPADGQSIDDLDIANPYEFFGVDRGADHRLDRESVDALAAYVGLIPLRVRRLVGQLDRWQWFALEAMWHLPEFASFLEGELLRVGPQFVLACLVLAEAHSLPKPARLALVHAIMSEPRCHLLSRLSREHWPWSALKCLYKLDFGRLEEECRCDLLTRELLADLLACLRCRERAKMVRHAARLSPHLIKNLQRLPMWAAPPNLTQLWDDPDVERVLIPVIDEVAEFADGETTERIRQSLAAVRTKEELPRKVGRFRKIALAKRPFPPPPVPGNEQLRPLGSVTAVHREAEEMANCLAALVYEVIKGKRYYYAWHGAERATVELRRAPDGRWSLGEYSALSKKAIVEIESILATQSPKTPHRRGTSPT